MVASHQPRTPSLAAFRGRALVVGLGSTGVAVARHLKRRGAEVRLAERSTDVMVPADLATLPRDDGSDPDAALVGVDLVVPSPGVPATSPLLRAAASRGIPIASEIELAAAGLNVPMIAITGTNGKSTTTELVAHLLGGSADRVFAGGNLGTPLVEAVGGPWDVVVVEVSSFQLEWVDSFHPRVALLLNVSPDHLDRHGDVETYAAVKARVFARQGPDDVAILNRDDEIVRSLAPGLASAVFTFGTSPLDGDGAEIRGDEIHVRIRGRHGVFGLARCPLLGAHNRENVMAAILAAAAMGASDDDIQAGIESVSALDHRMQQVHERAGVRFVDDSKGTNVGALLRSIEGLPDGRVVLIAGGLDKGSDFRPAREILARKARRVCLYGHAGSLLADAWRGLELEVHERFEDAVRAAAAAAKPDDVVLLSPACASFDQFENYARRGDAFASIVRSLE